jgi:hypothetical protein
MFKTIFSMIILVNPIKGTQLKCSNLGSIGWKKEPLVFSIETYLVQEKDVLMQKEIITGLR